MDEGGLGDERTLNIIIDLQGIGGLDQSLK